MHYKCIRQIVHRILINFHIKGIFFLLSNDISNGFVLINSYRWYLIGMYTYIFIGTFLYLTFYSAICTVPDFVPALDKNILYRNIQIVQNFGIGEKCIKEILFGNNEMSKVIPFFF